MNNISKLLAVILFISPLHVYADTLAVTPGSGVNINGKNDGGGNFTPRHVPCDATNPDICTPIDATKGMGVNELDGSNVTIGAKADAKSTATDTTPLTIMSVLKQISASVQSLVSGITATVSGTVSAIQSGAWNITNITGTISLPTGAGTSANQTSQITQETTTATGVGAPADAAYAGSGSAGLIAVGKGIYNALIAAVPAGTNTIGAFFQANGDPCSSQAHVYTPISLSAAATTVLVSGVSSKKKFICAIMLKNNAANNVALFSGSGATCGTSPHSVMGGQTTGAGFILAANDGFVAGSGSNAIAATSTNADDLCIALSAASQVSGYAVTVDN